MDNNTLFYFTSGSKTFCSNCSDEDIICIQKEVGESVIRTRGVDTFCFTIDNFRKRLFFNYSDSEMPYRQLYNVGFACLKQQGKIVGEMPDDIKNYNWIDYKDKIIELCLDQCKNYSLRPRVFNKINSDACLKHTYWIFANYFALVNNSLDFTEEQLDIIQKCHDNELPRSYAEDLYQKLLEMLPKQEPQEVEQPTISYDELVDSKIRARYTVSQEFAILRQRDTKPDEFAEYNAYCEQCKAEAKAELGIE